MVNSIATCVFQIASFGREEGIANPLANEQNSEMFLVKGAFGGQECLFPHGILIEGGSFSVRNYSFLFFSRPCYPLQKTATRASGVQTHLCRVGAMEALKLNDKKFLPLCIYSTLNTLHSQSISLLCIHFSIRLLLRYKRRFDHQYRNIGEIQRFYQ